MAESSVGDGIRPFACEDLGCSRGMGSYVGGLGVRRIMHAGLVRVHAFKMEFASQTDFELCSGELALDMGIAACKVLEGMAFDRLQHVIPDESVAYWPVSRGLE